MTEINRISADWKEVKNECRSTSNKEMTDKDATPEFIKNILISEHSPIRLVRIKWRWAGIPSWVSVHFARHWLGWEKWISTQRTDRTGVNRNELRQDTPVNMDVEANAQALINVSRYRLCFKAATETRQYMVNLKKSIFFCGQEELSEVMVPNCVYRCGCPEFKPCGFFDAFKKYCDENAVHITDIKERYDAYREFYL